MSNMGKGEPVVCSLIWQSFTSAGRGWLGVISFSGQHYLVGCLLVTSDEFSGTRALLQAARKRKRRRHLRLQLQKRLGARLLMAGGQLLHPRAEGLLSSVVTACEQENFQTSCILGKC